MEMVLLQNKETHYTAVGHVYGQLWGGDKGSYPTIKIKANSVEELEHKIAEALEDRSLDLGMGFEKLTGCLMKVTKYETLTIDGEHYTAEDEFYQYFGELAEKEKDHLVDVLYRD